MGLEDLAMMRALPGSTVLYPCDATSTAALVEQMPGLGAITYLRTTRGSYPVIYDAGRGFPIGGCKVLRSSSSDAVTLIGAGVTVHECLGRGRPAGRGGHPRRVIDLYSVKPLDMDTLSTAAEVTQGRVVVVEDHYPAGRPRFRRVRRPAHRDPDAATGPPVRARTAGIGYERRTAGRRRDRRPTHRDRRPRPAHPQVTALATQRRWSTSRRRCVVRN